MCKVTQSSIESFLKEKLSTDSKWALRALSRIYSFQTEDEKSRKDTYYINNVGFTGADGEFLSSLAEQWEEKHFLSEKQMKCLFKLMPKYWKQIWNISNQEQLINMIKASNHNEK
jgi:hypothetical protein